MLRILLVLPLLLTFVGAALAAAGGHPAPNLRLSVTWTAWLPALLPLAAFVFFPSRLPAMVDGSATIFSVAWMPSLGMTANLYFDNLSLCYGCPVGRSLRMRSVLPPIAPVSR